MHEVLLFVALAIVRADAGTPEAPRIVRPCEAVKALGSASASLTTAAAAVRPSRKVAPNARQFGFVPGRAQIVYLDEKTQALRVVSPEKGRARTISAPGHAVSGWRAGEEPGRVLYEAGGWYQVSLDELKATPVPVRAEAPAPNQDLLELRAAGVSHVGDALRISARYGLATIHPPGLAPRLVAYDLERKETRALLPPELTPEWRPRPVDDRRVLLRASSRLYLADLATVELSCVTASLPGGYSPWPDFVVSSDGRHVAHAAVRMDGQGARHLLLGLADVVDGTDTMLGTFARSAEVLLRSVPGTSRFLLQVRRDGPPQQGVFYALEPPGGLTRLTAAIPKLQSFEVAPDGRHVLYARGQVWTGPSIPPQPESRRPDPDDRDVHGETPTCDPIRPMPGDCGWVFDHCYDYVWRGFCRGEEPKPPRRDPADGLYLFTVGG